MNKQNTAALLLLAQQAAAIKITDNMQVDFHDVVNAGDINVYNGDDNCGNCNGEDDTDDDALEFHGFMGTHGKSYSSLDEYNQRKAQWKETHAKIQAHNADTTQTHTCAHNHLSDWSADEYAALLGTVPDLSLQASNFEQYTEWTNPAGVNWVSAGAVTPVKNQGYCGSCWSFSTTGAMEGAHHRATGNLVSLSEQQFVDCDGNNSGCNGGWPQRAFGYAQSAAIATEASYPYQGSDQTCNTSATSGATTKVASYVNVHSNDPAALVAQLNIGPVAVVLDAGSTAFGHYSSGVITGTACGSSINHAVLAVGYGTENGIDYYLVKNSWGTGWGAGGYLKIGREAGVGVCGIQYSPSQPTTTNV